MIVVIFVKEIYSYNIFSQFVRIFLFFLPLLFAFFQIGLLIIFISLKSLHHLPISQMLLILSLLALYSRVMKSIFFHESAHLLFSFLLCFSLFRFGCFFLFNSFFQDFLLFSLANWLD